MKSKLDEAREIINTVDAKMIELFKERMKAAKMVAEYKKEHNLPILDAKREETLIEKNMKMLNNDDLASYYESFLKNMLTISKDFQTKLIEKHYALIGHPLGHSISPFIHSLIFHKQNINASYELKDIEEKDLEAAIKELRDGRYCGYNVTIPYKEKIMPYLDEISIEAKAIGAVNTISCVNGKVIGYNTDYAGIKAEILQYKLDIQGKDIYILGSGGASKACFKAVTDLGGNPIVVSRTKNSSNISYEELYQLKEISGIINTTPVGMYPNSEEAPIDKTVASKAGFIIDVIFNPRKTKLMSYNDTSYNGLPMLIHQAIKAEEIWQKEEFNKMDLYAYIKGELNE